MGPLSREQIQHYRDEGWLLIGRVLDDAELATLRGEEERFRLGVAYGGPANQTLFVNIQLCHRSEPIRRFCTAGRHVPAVVRYCDPHVKMLSEGNRPVLEDPHSWMIAGEA